MDLLIVKIQALLRRTTSQQVESAASLTFKGYHLDLLNSELKNNSNSIPLSKNEVKLLYPLFKQPGEIVSREAIMEALWEDELFIDRNTLSVMVNRIRSKTKAIGFDQVLETVKGKGLRLHD